VTDAENQGLTPWQPFMQTAGCCFPLPVWFATEAECEAFIP
jgi:hypothetical protein